MPLPAVRRLCSRFAAPKLIISSGLALGTLMCSPQARMQPGKGDKANIYNNLLHEDPGTLNTHLINQVTSYKDNAISEPARLMCVVWRRNSKQE